MRRRSKGCDPAPRCGSAGRSFQRLAFSTRGTTLPWRDPPSVPSPSRARSPSLVQNPLGRFPRTNQTAFASTSWFGCGYGRSARSDIGPPCSTYTRRISDRRVGKWSIHMASISPSVASTQKQNKRTNERKGGNEIQRSTKILTCPNPTSTWLISPCSALGSHDSRPSLANMSMNERPVWCGYG